MYQLEFLGKIGSGSDTWSIFKNPSEELLDRILNRAPQRTFKVVFGIEWTIDADEPDEDGEIRCRSGKNIHYYKPEEIEEYMKDSKEEILGKEIDPAYHFFKFFCPLYKLTESGNSKHIRYITGGHKDPGSSMGYVEEYEFELVDNWNKIGLNYKHHYYTCFVKYDDNGNFLVRDYNVDITEYQQGLPPTKKVYDSFKKLILKFENFQIGKSSELWFSNKIMLQPFLSLSGEDILFTLDKVPVRSDGASYQEYAGLPITKKPKNLKAVLAKDILKTLESDFVINLENKFLTSDKIEYRPLQ